MSQPTAAEVMARFESELKRRAVRFTPGAEPFLYVLDVRGVTTTVSLANVARQVTRDGDLDAIGRFVDQVLSPTDVPGWEMGARHVLWSLEPADHDFGDAIRHAVSDEVVRVLVLTDPDQGKITWLTPELIRDWRVPLAQIEQVALENLSRMLEGKRPEVDDVDGHALGMLPVDSPFKASLILAPAFERFVRTKIGWPVLVVVPCRDFVYVLAEKDRALLDRMGGVVQREFRESAYPITTEVLRVSDAGIETIGTFPR